MITVCKIVSKTIKKNVILGFRVSFEYKAKNMKICIIVKSFIKTLGFIKLFLLQYNFLSFIPLVTFLTLKISRITSTTRQIIPTKLICFLLFKNYNKYSDTVFKSSIITYMYNQESVFDYLFNNLLESAVVFLDYNCLDI